jgi:hypothetical protein
VIRVCLALGSWQIVALDAALRQADAAPAGVEPREDHLVLYETVAVSAELKKAMREVAVAIRPWQRIVDAFDLLASVRRKISQQEFDALVAELRTQLDVERIDELWLCWLTRAPEKLVMEAYPEARVMLYEDGLFSYLPIRATPDEPAPAGLPWPAAARARLRERLDRWRPVRRFRRHKSWLDPVHERRVAGAWMLLADLWPAPAPLAHVPWRVIAPVVMRQTLADCASIPGVARFIAPERGRPSVLVLGQTLSRWGAMTRAQELALYAKVIDLVLERGYEVWWKEHPRSQQPFFRELAQRAPPGRLRELDLPFALPVELIAPQLGLAACTAGISTALFYLPRLYDIPTYTFADDLVPFLSDRWALQNELVRSNAPPLRELPMAAA